MQSRYAGLKPTIAHRPHYPVSAKILPPAAHAATFPASVPQIIAGEGLASADCVHVPTGPGAGGSGAVAKAIQFMQGNLAGRLLVAEIAAAAGVPERTLRRQFHRFTGHSPLAFHRNLRLEAAHRALNSRGSDTDVTTAATDHGFSHFGQFAARYRQRFDELPSATRRAGRARGASPPYTGHDRVTVAVLPFVGGDDPGKSPSPAS